MRRFSPLFLRSAFLAACVLGLSFSPYSAFAQEEPEMTFEEDVAEEEPEMTFDEEGDVEGEGELDMSDEPEPDDDLGLDLEPEPEPGAEGAVEIGATEVEEISWKDIVTVVRKPFLKINRIELLATMGTTMNDNIVRHLQFVGALNYYLTDVLAVGVEGQYFEDFFREPFDLVARQARRLPTVNKYNFGAALNFHYVPIYGKFAVLDEHIITWETALTAGVGFTQSEVIPRDPAHQPFKNILITPNVGASMRFFLNRFLTVNAGIRDYIFVDKFEAVSRDQASADIAKEQADSALVNNIIFQAGISIYFPMSFEYTTFR